LVITEATFSDKNAGQDKTVTAIVYSLDGADKDNYNLVSVGTTEADISKLGISGSFTAEGKTYDGTNSATVTGTSLSTPILDDDVSLVITEATFSNKNAGQDK